MYNHTQIKQCNKAVDIFNTIYYVSMIVFIISLLLPHIYLYNGINKGIVIDLPYHYSIGYEVIGNTGLFTCHYDDCK